jgi:predicted metal-dependent peptidase
MIQEINKLYEKTKGGLFFHKGAGFLGRLLCAVDFQWDESIETAAISTERLYWNPDFFLNCDPETRITVLAHELSHNGFLHPERLGSRNPELFNIAGDHVINLWLKKHGFYMGGFPYIMDHKYDGWSTDQVYDDLIQNPPPTSPYTLQLDIRPSNGTTKQKAVSTVVSAVASANMSGHSKDVPGEIQSTIDSFLRPKLPWTTLLRNYFTELTHQERSYARPNRRFDDPLLPGLSGRNGLEHLLYFVDVSGSITDQQVLRLNSEVAAIKQELEPEKLTLVLFDGEIQDVFVYEKDDPFEKLVITGRGGTDLTQVFDMIKKERPTASVIFTDLDVRIPPNPGSNILWVCVDSPNAKVPYGTLVHVSTDMDI